MAYLTSRAAVQAARLIIFFRNSVMSARFLFTLKLIALCALFMRANPSFAHITLEQQQVEANQTYKATLRVGHGCDGLPTHTVRALIPAGFKGAKPMPKAGWSVSTKKAKLDKPYDNHGTLVTDDVVEVTWTATTPASYLADDQYDEFVLRGRAPEAAGPAWFKVTQLCKGPDGKEGINNWAEVPASGTNTRDLKYPAALLNVVAPAAATATATQAAKPVEPSGNTGHKH
jgi:periplasmic copper chaperone A